MEQPRTILITGAAGNLGSLLARHLIPRAQQLRLMYHHTPLPADVLKAPKVSGIQADLGDPRTLPPALREVHVVVYFAGVLFAPNPERFLPIMNTQWFSNLLVASLEAQVERVVLISFPHVEGTTSVEQPATGRLNRRPISVHAQTRLDGIRSRHRDDRRGALAGAAPPAVCLAGADLDATSFYG
jgi:nucleoside-diphosphate-sugar epimerase